jgi:hypothetical protein
LTHPTNGKKGDFNTLAKEATYTHTKADNTTEELPLAWTKKTVDMRYYGKADNEHDTSEEPDIQEILVAYDTNGKKYTIFEDEPPKADKKGKMVIEDA